MGDERFVIMSIFLLKSDRPQAFTGKRCGLGVLEGRKKGEKKETQRIPSLFFSKLPDESKTISANRPSGHASN